MTLPQYAEKLMREKVRDLEEEVQFWKDETLECRNVLASLTEDIDDLQTAAIAYNPKSVDALQRLEALLSASKKYSDTDLKATAPRRPIEKKKRKKKGAS